jgi:hypothetical protein
MGPKANGIGSNPTAEERPLCPSTDFFHMLLASRVISSGFCPPDYSSEVSRSARARQGRQGKRFRGRNGGAVRCACADLRSIIKGENKWEILSSSSRERGPSAQAAPNSYLLIKSPLFGRLYFRRQGRAPLQTSWRRLPPWRDTRWMETASLDRATLH